MTSSSPPCGNATASMCRPSSWSAMTSGWRRPASCASSKSGWSRGEFGGDRHLRPVPRATRARRLRPCLRRPAREGGRDHVRTEGVPRSSGCRPRSGRHDHPGSTRVVRRDGQGKALDAFEPEGGGRHPRGRRDLSRRDLLRGPCGLRGTGCTRRQAQAVLQALLPESGTDIKGQMRSAAELQARLRLRQSAGRFRRFDPSARRGIATRHADRARARACAAASRPPPALRRG